MAENFVDRKSTYPNRYKITRADRSTEYVTLERADEPSVEGTPLNAAVFNEIVTELGNKIPSNAPIVLTEGMEYHYGNTLPKAGTSGRLFFLKKVT
jgi:hypothetical protein